MSSDLSRARWFTSSYSNGSGHECVEVALLARRVAVRDSKDRGGPVLAVRTPAWVSLLDGIRRSEFDA